MWTSVQFVCELLHYIKQSFTISNEVTITHDCWTFQAYQILQYTKKERKKKLTKKKKEKKKGNNLYTANKFGISYSTYIIMYTLLKYT